ncbi:MAG TPA: hypothetical protein VFZ21_05290, partial [Gemmatimonadaceae bacterium]|nr:hypothetical protein [Gemmatimonadaceae bacterium]
LDPRAPDLLLRLRMFAHAAFVAPLPTAKALGPVVAPVLGWVLGMYMLWRRNRVGAVLIGAPLVLAMGASVLGLYPVMDRLYLFAAPLVLIGLGAFAAGVLAFAPEARRRVGLIAICVGVALYGVETHVERVRNPVYFGVGKQIVADVDSMSRGDPVYVAARSFPLWVFYSTDWERPDTARIAWAAGIAGAGKPAHNNAPSRRRRVEPGEARLLVREYRGRTEVVGLPTGRQYLTSTRTLDPTLAVSEYALPLVADTGWAEVEVDRMAEVARPTIWVFGSHMFALDGAEPGLVAELQRRGVRLVMERRQGGTVAYHVEFPRVDPTIQPD